MKKVVLIKVPSQSDKNQTWIVKVIRQDNEIQYECNCPAFLFRNPDRNPCKHILLVISELDKRRHNAKNK